MRVTSEGRHRLYRLANDDVAVALEALARVAPRTPVRSLRQAGTSHALALARSCYDHAAGAVAVALADRLVEADAIAPLVAGEVGRLRPGARAALAPMGIEVATLLDRSRPAMRGCLDWTQRRPHVAGVLGAALLDVMLHQRWMRRRPSDRALTISGAGEKALLDHFGIDVPLLRRDLSRL